MFGEYVQVTVSKSWLCSSLRISFCVLSHKSSTAFLLTELPNICWFKPVSLSLSMFCTKSPRPRISVDFHFTLCGIYIFHYDRTIFPYSQQEFFGNGSWSPLWQGDLSLFHYFHFIYFHWLRLPSSSVGRNRYTTVINENQPWDAKKQPQRLQPRTQLIQGRYMKTDSGKQLVNSAD